MPPRKKKLADAPIAAAKSPDKTPAPKYIVNKHSAAIFIPRRVNPMDSFTPDECDEAVLEAFKDKGWV